MRKQKHKKRFAILDILDTVASIFLKLAIRIFLEKGLGSFQAFLILQI
jgi:hypothetical protein